MNVFTTSLIHHGAAIQRLLRKYSVEANVNLADFGLVVRGRNRYYRFYPQFIWDDSGRVQFSPEIVPRVRSFVGWRPYFNKRFPIGYDKTAFKDYCARHGLRTPQMWRTPAADMRDFLVKHTRVQDRLFTDGRVQFRATMGKTILADLSRNEQVEVKTVDSVR